VLLPTPRRKRASQPPLIPDHFKQAPPSTRKQLPPKQQDLSEDETPETIAAASFYSRHSGAAADEKPAAPRLPVEQSLEMRGSRSEPPRKAAPRTVRRSPPGKRASVKRTSAGGGGGGKHKRSGLGLAGVSHAIRRPKKRPAVVPVKISEIPAVSIELPRSVASARAEASEPSTPHGGGPLVSSPGDRRAGGKTPSSSSNTPKTGNFRLSKETRVDVEVKAGQIVYRKMAKISTTPLRRSPRKNLSPLKESYLAESGRTGSRNGRRSGGAQKLFSPQGPADFLGAPASGSNKSPRKLIPSPVKFRVAADEVQLLVPIHCSIVICTSRYRHFLFC
jgi:hypothetical protein